MATTRPDPHQNDNIPSLYWHDYETFGVDPRRDRPVQFAGIRTDLELNVIGEPLNIFCKPANDFLPHPKACLVTGITPQQALAEGVPEAEFIRQIHDEFSQPNTCVVGYNNLRFDDEVTRFTLYRNFYDAYAREWQNGNSRWDIIDVVRLTHALRPEGIVWPTHENGKTSFRLEQLTAANGIAHDAAHDAVSDVLATIAMARLIREKQPKLYHYVFTHRSKQTVAQRLNVIKPTPVLHVSSMYPAERGCISLVAPLAQHPTNKNEIIVYDLRIDPTQFFTLNETELKDRLFTRQNELPEGYNRLPVKTIHINRSPVVVPANTLTPDAAARWQLDPQRAQQHLEQLLTQIPFIKKLQEIYRTATFETITDPDFMLYSGGFFSNDDRARMEDIRNTPPENLADLDLPFKDPRLEEMLFRYRARNYPDTLNDAEKNRWEEFRMARLTGTSPGAGIGFDEYNECVAELRNSGQLNTAQLAILDKLDEYSQMLMHQ
ncbi:MAG TPA: exodeoxyribonuclease I [Gammaproteobacteria bacterium]|nr:exodeoxyribonuclease I [Gammaproteobacteria bacterium]